MWHKAKGETGFVQTRFRQHYRAQMFVVAVLQQLAPSVRDNKAIVKSHVEQVFAAELSITKKIWLQSGISQFFCSLQSLLIPHQDSLYAPDSLVPLCTVHHKY